jgi:hypothetical protein
VHAPSRTMLAHYGVAQESWGSAGRVETVSGSHPPWLACHILLRRGRRGEGRTGVGQACLLEGGVASPTIIMIRVGSR